MNTEWIFYELLSLCGILFLFWNSRRKCEHKLPPAFPGKLPLIGHAHLLLNNTEELLKIMGRVARDCVRQGGVTTGFIGTRIFYIVTDPEDALKAANSCLDKNFAYEHAKTWMGDGLITASGETWKRRRRLLSPAFGLPVVTSSLEVFNSINKLLVKDFENLVGKGFIDPSINIRTRSLETFCLTSFGVYANKPGFIDKYLEAVDKMLMLMTLRFCNPFYQFDFTYKLSGWKKEEEKYIRILNSLTREIIKRKKAAMNEKVDVDPEKKYKPLLDVLMELSDADVLTEDEIREEVDTAIVAGFDTTANILVYVMMMLGSLPSVQERVYKEIIETVGIHRDVEKDDLAKLEYTEAVIKETMRYYNTGPGFMRYVDKDVKLKNYTMRAGSQLVLMPFGTHRDPVWGKDCEEYKPERWLDAATVPIDAFGGFSLGKRRCIGKIYALVTMKVTLAHIVRRFKITSDVTKLRMKVNFSVKPVAGHEITLERREYAV